MRAVIIHNSVLLFIYFFLSIIIIKNVKGFQLCLFEAYATAKKYLAEEDIAEVIKNEGALVIMLGLWSC